MAKKQRGRTEESLMLEVGDTGLDRWGGYIDDEFHPKLKGRLAAKVYREMGSNHPIIGAFLFFMQMLGRRVEYTFVLPDGESTPERERARTLVEEAFDDIPGKLPGTVCELLSMAQFGWAWVEKVFKIRRGDHESKHLHSKYDDGAWGWRKLAPRAQESLARWEFDEHGEVLGLWQRAAPNYIETFVSRERILLTQLLPYKGSPEGLCLLRPIYVPYYTQTVLQLTEAIGLERSLSGLPVIRVPRDVATATSGDKYNLRKRLEKLASNIRKDAYGGLVFVIDEDDQGKTGYDIDLMSSSGANKTEADASIRRYREEIAIGLMYQFSLIGMQEQGSRSLASSHTDMLAIAADGLINAALAPLNEDAIPELCGMNGIRREDAPIIEHGDFEKQDLAVLGSFVAQLSGAGMIQPRTDLENALLRAGDLPEVESEAGDDGAPLPTSADIEETLVRINSGEAGQEPPR